jgi:hypothetical protein
MLELTDDRLPGDPRNGLAPTGGGDGLVQVSGVEHVAAVVVDLDPVTALLDQVFGVEPRVVTTDGPETVADFDIGDLTLRVVAPHDESSGWHPAIANGRSSSIRSPSQSTSPPHPTRLAAAGIGIAREDEGTPGSIPPTPSACASNWSTPDRRTTMRR